MIRGHSPFQAGLPRSWTAMGSQPAGVTFARLGQLEVQADSWLDNRRELAATFGLETVPDDAVLIAHAYRRWGVDCPKHLLGDFAFAIHDAEVGRLLLVRDPQGARLLHYVLAREGVAFAGDVEWLLAQPDLSLELDEELLAVWLHWPWEFVSALSRRSFWRGLLKLPPGHRLDIGRHGARLERWQCWEDAPAVRFRRDGEYAEAYRELLERAVQRGIDTTAGVGTHLSGGADCSSLAVLAQRALRRRGGGLKAAYTWFAPPDAANPQGEDLYSRVERLAAAERIPLRSQVLDATACLSVLAQDFTRRSSHMLVYENTVQAQAQADGVGVMLSGWGGDEFATSQRWAAWYELLHRGHGLRAIQESHRHGRLRGLPSDMARWLWHGWLPKWRACPSLVGPGTPGSLPFIDPAYIAPLLETPGHAPLSWSRHEAGLLQNQLMYLEQGHLTRRIESWAAAGRPHGIVYRYPMLDRELLNFCLGLPPEQYILGGQSRSLFRRALAGHIPDEIRLTEKPPEVQRVLRVSRAMDAAHAELLARARLAEPPPLFAWVDYAALGQVLAAPLAQASGIGLERHFVQRQAARIALLSRTWAETQRRGSAG